VVENMRRIRVLVVDDHGLMVEAVRLALDPEADIEVVGEARCGGDVLPAVARRQPDVVLLDVRMPDVDGLTVLARLHARHPDVKVVMLSAISDPEVANEALRLGATAYLDKRVDPADLASTLRKAAAGEPCAQAPRRHGNGEDPAPGQLTLSPREREILGHVGNGLSNMEIARELWLSEQTVKYHLTNVYRKLGVKGRTGATRFAFEHGLVDPIEDDVRASGPNRPGAGL
jgi:DNA-binding NarL/FixJ family response regulator